MTDEAQAKPKKRNPRHEIFKDAYLRLWNATDAYQEAYPKASREICRRNGSRLLSDVDIKADVDARIAESHMSADEALDILGQQARGSIGTFFKLVEEWTFYPLPTYEILGAKEVVDDTDPDNPKLRVSYWVRHVAIDMDKVIDPRYSGLLQEFSDSPKNGLSIKVYSRQAAIDKILRVYGKFVDKTEITGKDGKDLLPAIIQVYLPDNGRDKRD